MSKWRYLVGLWFWVPDAHENFQKRDGNVVIINHSPSEHLQCARCCNRLCKSGVNQLILVRFRFTEVVRTNEGLSKGKNHRLNYTLCSEHGGTIGGL
jgi:hypothetical protein